MVFVELRILMLLLTFAEEVPMRDKELMPLFTGLSSMVFVLMDQWKKLATFILR